MRPLLLLAMVTAFGLQQADGAIWNFVEMITKVTGEGAVSRYNGYGCHCGCDGKGSPVDAMDWCCFERDCCHDLLKSNGCATMFLNYDVDYRENWITCKNQDYCRRRLCDCDRAAALCFKRNMGSYNTRYQDYKKRSCPGSIPMCEV